MNIDYVGVQSRVSASLRNGYSVKSAVDAELIHVFPLDVLSRSQCWSQRSACPTIATRG
jgi:hypothetical protein